MKVSIVGHLFGPYLKTFFGAALVRPLYNFREEELNLSFPPEGGTFLGKK